MTRFSSIIISCLVYLHCYAQDEAVLQGEFHQVLLTDLLEKISKENTIKFNYLDDVVKDVRVSGILRHKTPVMKALITLLQDTRISVAENGDGNLVLFTNPNKILKNKSTYYSVSGTVKDRNTGEPLPYVTVQIQGAMRGAVSDEKGNFVIKPFEGGGAMLQISCTGYETIVKKVDVDRDLTIELALEESAQELQEVVISPSTFEISTVEASPLTLGKEEVLHSPNMGKDIYRTLRTLPGVANNDYSAKARIRGGHSDETAVYLDNFLINDAFHIDEVDGAFSIFNTDYIDEVKVLTGGFSARYTDRLSGVIDVRTFDNVDADKYRLSADLLNLSFLSQKKINNKVNVSFNARRGYLDFLLKDMYDEGAEVVDPRFSDMWAKVTYKANPKNNLSFNFLYGRDKFHARDFDNHFDHLEIKNTRSNINGWINWKWFPSQKFDALTTIGYQQLGRDGTFAFSDNTGVDNLDTRESGAFVFTNNSYYHLNDNGSFEFGTELRKFNAAYTYREQRYDLFNSTADDIILDDINVETSLNGFTGSAYLQYDKTFFKKLAIQPGIRMSAQSFSTGVKWGPRIAASYDIAPWLNTRWAYGIYYQPDLYYHMRTAQYQSQLFNKNGKAIHYTGSVTYSRKRTNIMLNVYHKDYRSVFDDYRSEFFNRIGGIAILDIPFNTKSAYAQGAEITWRQSYGRASMLSVTYAYSRSRIRNADGMSTKRDFDQPHVVVVNNIFRLPGQVNMSLFWNFHTGYPYTPTRVDFIVYRPQQEGVILFYDAGVKNSERLPNFHTLDLRVEKTWVFGKSTLTAYINVINLFNRENLRAYWWYPVRLRNNSIIFEQERTTNIPVFVSPGISFTLF